MPPALINCENQILNPIAKGFTSGQITCNLSISKITVDNQLYELYRKLGISNRQQAVAYVFHRRIIFLKDVPENRWSPS
jgi:DNA-binding NarL/FixJ family response regulator